MGWTSRAKSTLGAASCDHARNRTQLAAAASRTGDIWMHRSYQSIRSVGNFELLRAHGGPDHHKRGDQQQVDDGQMGGGRVDIDHEERGDSSGPMRGRHRNGADRLKPVDHAYLL